MKEFVIQKGRKTHTHLSHEGQVMSNNPSEEQQSKSDS